MDRTHVNLIMLAHGHVPVIILPALVGGGHTHGFRQKTIPDRQLFDKLMESGSRVIDWPVFKSRASDAPSRLKGGDLDKNKMVVSRVEI